MPTVAFDILEGLSPTNYRKYKTIELLNTFYQKSCLVTFQGEFIS